MVTKVLNKNILYMLYRTFQDLIGYRNPIILVVRLSKPWIKLVIP